MTSAATTEFEFVDQLPQRTTAPFGSQSIKQKMFNDFAEALRKNPLVWAKYPAQVNLKTIRQIAWGIRKGCPPSPLSLRSGEFDAAVREGVLYVRWTGESV